MFFACWSKLIQITYEGIEQGKQSSFSIQPLHHQRKIKHLWALFISCKLISSEVRFPSQQAFPATIVATTFSSRGRGHTCQSWRAIQGLCLTSHSHNRPVCCCCTEDSVSHWHRYHTGQQVTNKYTGPLGNSCLRLEPEHRIWKTVFQTSYCVTL